ncbi:MAG TPA: amidase [Gemmatimonadaceae bacterium]|nr:amidase [Gemmatimonadaceae bacterium]
MTAQFVPRNDSRFHSTMPHDADHRAPSAAPLSRRDFVAATGAAAVGGPLARLLPPMPAPQPMSTRESPEPAVQDPRALSLIDLATAIRSGRLTSEATVRAYLDRIEVVNPTLNAVVQLRRDAALAEARIADRVPMEKRGALHGVPVTIKDSLDTAGIISTGGTMGRASYVPAEDATVVKRLRAAGAIILGKTNTPDVTLAFETNNLVYGRTNNPYDVSRTSGGSSGGAAAIIAAGGSPLDIGSDTGGSIRVPAHFCGIAGHKPTAGRVPRTGHIIDYTGPIESLTHLGPLARRVDDLALVLPLIAGPDGVDPHAPAVPLGDHRKVTVRGLRVAHFTNLGALRPTVETASAVEGALRILEKAGCRLHAIEIPGADGIYALYTGLMWNDGGAGVRRILERWGTTQSPLFDRIGTAANDSSGDVTARYERWDRYRSELLGLFADYDVMVCPVYIGPAPAHGTFARPSAAYTQLFDLTGWPSTVIRAGTSPEGLPIGVQCVAQPWREDVSLAVARHLETAFGAWPGPVIG